NASTRSSPNSSTRLRADEKRSRGGASSPLLLCCLDGPALARRRDVGRDEALVSVCVDRSDAEDVIVNLHVWQDRLRHVADEQIVLPIRSPRVAPEDAIRNCARRRGPPQVRVIARRLTADGRLAPLIGDAWRRGREAE